MKGEGGIWERERACGALLPRAWSRALILFPYPFERLPRKLSETMTCNFKFALIEELTGL